MAGDVQCDSGTLFDPLQQFWVYEVGPDGRSVVGRCMFGPIDVGQAFDMVAAGDGNEWETSLLDNPRVLVNSIDQMSRCRIRFDREIDSRIATDSLLIRSAENTAAVWRRGERLWHRVDRDDETKPK